MVCPPFLLGIYPIRSSFCFLLSRNFLSAQVVPGSGVFGTAFSLGPCAAKILPKMVLPGLSLGVQLVEMCFIFVKRTCVPE